MIQSDKPHKAFKEFCHSEFPQTNIPSRRVFKYYKKYFLNLNPKILKLQSIKRINAKTCRFDSRTEDNHDFLKTLKNAMKSLKRMKSKKITFHFDFRIIYTKLAFLTENVKINPFLRSLHLDFEESLIDNETLYRLRKALQRIHFLKDLNINFYECSALSDRGVKRFSQGLKNLTNLQIISLNFFGCTQITNLGLCSIEKALHCRLEKIYFDFSKCQISEKGFGQMNKYFKNLIKLKDINLKFDFCNGFEPELKRMREILENLPCLPNVNIDCFDDENEDEYEYDDENIFDE